MSLMPPTLAFSQTMRPCNQYKCNTLSYMSAEIDVYTDTKLII